MKNCKNFKIYKFKFAYPYGESFDASKERWKRAKEMTDFKVKLIDEFCSLKFVDLGQHTFFSGKERVPYKKPWLTSPFEIGQDMLQEEQGIEFHYSWDQLYIAVPLSKPNIIEFFDGNIPEWVTIVKKI